MKKAFLSLFLIGFVASPALAANDKVSNLAGSWKGAVTVNLKDSAGGGNPTAAATGAPVSYDLKSSASGVAGTSTVGSDPAEKWTFSGNSYSWNDGTITVTADKISCDALKNDRSLSWMSEKANLNKLGSDDTCVAYHYKSCTVNKDGSPCKIGEQLPNGIQNTGTWIFVVSKETMTQHVCYNYSTGGMRQLSQELKKSGK